METNAFANVVMPRVHDCYSLADVKVAAVYSAFSEDHYIILLRIVGQPTDFIYRLLRYGCRRGREIQGDT